MSDLPPLEAPQAYVVVGPDDQRGPYTLELLIGEVLAGRLSDATPVWWPGLADWTTMNGHHALAGEIQRRRSTATASAPGWSDPTASTAAPQPTYEQPSYEQPSYGQSSYGQSSYDQSSYDQSSYDQPAPEQPGAHGQSSSGQAPYEQSGYGQEPGQSEPQSYQPQSYGQAPYEQPQQVVYEQSAPAASPEPASSGDTGGALIDVDAVGAVSWVSGSDAAPITQDRDDSVYRDLVRRSAARAGEAERVAAAEERFLGAVVDGATRNDFVINGRDLVDGRTELRFDGTGDSHLVVTVGRIADLAAAEVRTATVPLVVAVRTSAQGSVAGTSTGEHGEVVVVVDEWSGQTSSTVSLVLGLEDYFGDDLALDHDAVVRDVAAAVGAVRSGVA